MILCNVALLIAMIIRVVILQTRYDSFNMLGLFDMVCGALHAAPCTLQPADGGGEGRAACSRAHVPTCPRAHVLCCAVTSCLQVILDLYLVAIILYVVKCNNYLDGHTKMLEAEKLKIAKQAMIAEGSQRSQFEQVCVLASPLLLGLV